MGTPDFHEQEGAMAVAKPELGIKRQCANCGAKFYDLAKTPILCPKCGTVFEVTATARRTAAKAVAAETPEAPTADPETVSLQEVAEQEKRKPSAKGASPDVDADSDDDVEDSDTEDDTFLEEEEEETGDVSDLIGEGIDKKEEET
jgi:uncharacterized protein (TIGR02300 family)